MFPKKLPQKDEDSGKPLTQPRQIYTKKNYSGKIEGHPMQNKPWSTYFEPGKFNAAKPGDIYKDPKKFTLKTTHPEAEVKFRPAKTVTHAKKERVAAYESMSEYVEVKKNYKDPDGGVITGPPNMKTNPMKKGTIPSGKRKESSLFHPVHEHVVNGIADNYDRQKEIAKEERDYHAEKIGDRPAFSQAANHRWKGGKKLYFHFGTINTPSQVLEDTNPQPGPLTRIRER